MYLHGLRDFLGKLKPYKTLTGGTTKQWADWERNTKQSHPRAWFWHEVFIEGCVDGLEKWVVEPLHNAKWWFLYRFTKAQNYHRVLTTLKPGYHNASELLLDASMAVLCQHYERQLSENRIDWQADDRHQNMWRDMTELYTWWKSVRPNRTLKELPDVNLPDDFLMFEPEYRNHPEVEAFRIVADENRKLRDKYEEEDQAMLLKLLQIRPGL